MLYDPHDTIAAIATAAGGAARGIVRVSGPAANDIVARCFAPLQGPSRKTLSRFTVTTGQIEIHLDETTPHRLPCELFSWPADSSYTRQNVVEFHTIGSPPLVRATLDSVCRAGARLAEPGEFTLRAFLTGRIDLTQAEAVLGVVDAQHAYQLQAAVTQLAGGLSGPLHRLREELLQLLAEVEAGLDFVEEDIEFISRDELHARLRSVAAEIAELANQLQSRLDANDLPQVALVGPPNVGKSSLFNALSKKRGRKNPSSRPDSTPAIVSGQRGTTRDYLTNEIELGSIRCELVDTAGVESDDFRLRGLNCGLETADSKSPAAMAQALSHEQRRRATIRAHCVDASSADADEVQRLPRQLIDRASEVDLIVLTKADLAPQMESIYAPQTAGVPIVATSAITGQGLDLFCQTIAALLDRSAGDDTGTCVAATANRCRESLRHARDAVERAAESATLQSGDELVAAELRVALTELGKVVGAVYTDDILDRIFSHFCIGK